MTPSAPASPAGTRRRFVLPPRHRLFCIFDDPEKGRKAVDELKAGRFGDPDDIWVFFGDTGLAELGAIAHGWRAALIRVVQRTMTNDFSYFRALEAALGDGALVIAVRVDSQHNADEVAKPLRDQSAHSFAYGAHWDFVPVAA